MQNATKQNNYDEKVREMSEKLSLPKESVRKLAVFEYYNKHFLEEDK